VGWGVLLACTALAVWPLGPLKTLSAHERRGWIGSIWLALLAVVLLKGISQTSCPWDLEVFGGSAQHLSHWAWGRTDGGPGHCFPAGHASTGFAFVAGGFWLAPHHPTLARRWWWAAGAAGAVLGGAQQLRGAHFMSHTLWSGWLCWAMGVAIWHLSKRRFQ
jgi:membrane-associated PAP2 superfamily phosphatase